MLGTPGGIVEKEAAIQASNVAILNPETNKADRVGFAIEDGKKQRVFKSTASLLTRKGEEMANFKTKYREEILPKLKEELGVKTFMKYLASQNHPEHGCG